jgi:predicted ATPase/class 3 adenylate cyclase
VLNSAVTTPISQSPSGIASTQPSAVAEAAPGADYARGERCQVTIMFCDLVGSTNLSQQLDPEDLQTVLNAYLEVSSKVIQRFDGYISKYLGDGLLVFFGYPRTHEDDGHRAIRTGLGIVEAVTGLAKRMRDQYRVDLSVRVGIHTGLVVAGETGALDRRTMDVVGEAPNVAARLQEFASPNTVVLSQATERLVHGYFECQALGSISLKGIRQPVTLFRALRESTARSRLEAATTSGTLTPLVGRTSELQALIDRWERARAGDGQVVMVEADPGIGKSRLLQALKEHVARDPQAWLTELYCSPYHQHTAFQPAIDLLERSTLQFTSSDTPKERLAKLEGVVVEFGFALEEMAPVIADLLSIPVTGIYPPLLLSPERRKQKIMEFYQGILMHLAQRQPLLFVIEDMHWMDPSTLEWIQTAVQYAPAVAMMIVCTCRHQPALLLPEGDYVTEIHLQRLGIQDTEEMMQRVAGGKRLPAEVIQQIVEKVEGVPLFVEEFTKMVIESGNLREQDDHYLLVGPLPSLAIPSTLHDSLAARLDRLSTVREVALWGAVLGREFNYDLLAAVVPMDEVALLRGLSKLVAAELILSRALPNGEVIYRFKHALLQDAAYESLLKSRRQHCHARVADVLERRFPHLVESQIEIMAHHLTEAGQWERALIYWQRAGEQAIARSAHLEAIGHLSRALELLAEMPETREHQQKELQLQIRLGVSLTATQGYGKPNVGDTYARARRLGETLGDTDQSFMALYGLWRHHMLRAEHNEAQEYGIALMTYAQAVPEPGFAVAANRALAATYFYLGNYVPSRTYCANVISATETQKHDSQTLIQDMYDVVDPRVTAYSYDAWSLWMLGFPEQAHQSSAQAISLATKLGHPFSQALAHCFAAWLHQFLRDPATARIHARTAIDISLAQEFPFWIGWARIIRGWAATEHETVEAGLQEMRQGLTIWNMHGSDLGRGYFLTLQADALRTLGRADEGLQALSEAETFATRTGECWWEPERHRLRGELLSPAATTKAQKAECAACFQQALELARKQSARALALRAALSLARFDLRLTGALSDACRATLQDEFGHFNEGFGTADLQEAAALLAS